MALPVANAGSDQVIAFASLPTTANLTGGGTPGTGGSSIVSYSWSLLEKPAGSSAALSSTTAQNPTLNAVDTWGNYRLLLVVTDDIAQVSESDELLAPNSAFVQVRVSGQYAGLQKPAPGERDWDSLYHDLVEEVETQRNDQDSHTIASHADTTATGAELNTLTGGGLASGLHRHAGGEVGAATTSTRGAVLLAEDPVSAPNPKAVTQDRMHYTACVSGTDKSGGWDPDVIAVQTYGGIERSEAHAVFPLREAVYLADWEVVMLDGGSAAGVYTIVLYEMTLAQLKANDFAGATTLDTLTLTQGATAREPTKDSGSIAASVSAGNYLAVRVTAAPATPGQGLCVSIGALKRW